MNYDDKLEAMLAQMPYAAFLGLRFAQDETGLLGVLPYQDSLIGNPDPAAIHGGVTATFLEMTAQASLVTEDALWPRVISFTTSYLRPGLQMDSFARAHIIRAGRRFATVEVVAWQDDPERPIARALGSLARG